jgi:hypothetical protein
MYPQFLGPSTKHGSRSERLFHKIIQRNGKKTVLEYIDKNTVSFKVDLGKINIEILKKLTRLDIMKDEYHEIKDLDPKDLLAYLVVKEFSLKVTREKLE